MTITTPYEYRESDYEETDATRTAVDEAFAQLITDLTSAALAATAIF